MNFDIAHILEDWEYKPGQVLSRRLKRPDGREIIQLRIDLGILQMFTEGRPDGKRPFGRDSFFEHVKERLASSRTEDVNNDQSGRLTSEECLKLHQEALQYHHRYICLLQLDDYEGVLRDTQRNREVFDFVEEFAPTEELAWSLQQFRPQLLMMETRASASQRLLKDDYNSALSIIDQGVEDIKQFFSERSRTDLIEHSGEIHSLEAWAEEIRNKKPLTEKERLEKNLKEAVLKEDYEEAARVRDALKKLDLRK